MHIHSENKLWDVETVHYLGNGKILLSQLLYHFCISITGNESK